MMETTEDLREYFKVLLVATVDQYEPHVTLLSRICIKGMNEICVSNAASLDSEKG